MSMCLEYQTPRKSPVQTHRHTCQTPSHRRSLLPISVTQPLLLPDQPVWNIKLPENLLFRHIDIHVKPHPILKHVGGRSSHGLRDSSWSFSSRRILLSLEKLHDEIEDHGSHGYGFDSFKEFCCWRFFRLGCTILLCYCLALGWRAHGHLMIRWVIRRHF